MRGRKEGRSKGGRKELEREMESQRWSGREIKGKRVSERERD